MAMTSSAPRRLRSYPLLPWRSPCQAAALARVFVARDFQQSLAYFSIAAELLGAIDQPQIQLVLGGAQVGDQLGVVALRIVHQITWMNFEEASQQHATGVGEVWTGAAFDLRQVRLADLLSQVLRNRVNHLLLCEGPAKAVKGALHLAEVTDFLAELHIANCD